MSPKMLSSSSFLSILFVFLQFNLQLFVKAQQQNLAPAEFVHFTPFNFSVSGDEPNGTTKSTLAKLFAFPVAAANNTKLVNISLSTEAHSAVVVSAYRCVPHQHDDELISNNDDNLSSLNSATPLMMITSRQPEPPASLVLFGDPDDYKSVLISPDELLPIDVDHGLCSSGSTNLTNSSAVQQQQQLVILFQVHAMLAGSRGTLAVRSVASKKDDDEEADDDHLLLLETIEEDDEWLLGADHSLLMIPLNGTNANGSREHGGRLISYGLDMAIRRGSAELTLLRECRHLLAAAVNGSESAAVAAPPLNRTMPLGNFASGQYPRLLDIQFGDVDDANGTASAESKNGTSTPTTISIREKPAQLLELDCPRQEDTAEVEPSGDEVDSGRLHLLISSISASADADDAGLLLVALSQRRVFVRSPLLRAANSSALGDAAPSSSTSASVIVLIIIGFLSPFLLLALAACVLLALWFARRARAARRRVHYERECKAAMGQPVGFFELNPMDGRRRAVPKNGRVAVAYRKSTQAVNIDAQALAQQAVGGVDNFPNNRRI